MKDELVRAMTKDGWVKAVAITSTGIVERARQIHKTLPTATAALGRLLSAASMMGNMQKIEDGSITLQVKGGGPLGTLLAVSDAEGNVRGWVENPQISLMEKHRGKLDVGAAVGTDGTLTVIRDLRMKEPYVGSVQLVTGEIAEDITDYFARSEQTPTACALGVLVDTDQSVKCAGGYLVQLLPGAPDSHLRARRHRRKLKTIPASDEEAGIFCVYRYNGGRALSARKAPLFIEGAFDRCGTYSNLLCRCDRSKNTVVPVPGVDSARRPMPRFSHTRRQR